MVTADQNALCEKIAALADSMQPELLKFLEKAVNQDSGSYDTEDVNAFGVFLTDACRKLGADVLVHDSSVHGNPIACAFNCKTDDDTRRVLMICHRDTVFEHDTAKARPFTVKEGLCHGPGCADMKGGITIGIHAVKLLKSLADFAGDVPLEIVFSSDEEIGSEASAQFITSRCRKAKAAFFLEPARPGGELVTGRDGGDLLTLEAFGHSAHAGNSFAEGISAIYGIAEVISEFAKLSDDVAGYSCNVGTIEGGTGAIIVPDYAVARIYTRFSTLEQREYLLKNFTEICDRHSHDGLKVTISKPVGFLPFIPNDANRALFDLVHEAGTNYGLDLKGICVRGAADAGIASCEGVPTICGMGIVGGNLHTDREYAVASSLSERLKVLATALVFANERFD